MLQQQATTSCPEVFDDQGIEALLHIADLYADQARDLCQRAGVQPGGRAIDVGCGPIGALLVLSDLVGPSGSVVGMDTNAASLARARAILDRRGIGNVTLVHATLDELDTRSQLGDGPFDAAFARRFLIWQPNPVEAVRTIVALLRPGAHLIATDPVDAAGYPAADPAVPELEPGSRLLFELIRARGGSPSVVRRYRRLCSEVGLEIVHLRAFIDCLHAESDFELLGQALQVCGPSLQAHGLATEAELKHFVERFEWAKHQEMESYFGPIMGELIARVPE